MTVKLRAFQTGLSVYFGHRTANGFNLKSPECRNHEYIQEGGYIYMHDKVTKELRRVPITNVLWEEPLDCEPYREFFKAETIQEEVKEDGAKRRGRPRRELGTDVNQPVSEPNF